MEKSAGFVIYKKEKGKTEYLLLKYPSERGDYWGLPKGHLEEGETPLRAAKRELFEETGLKEEDIEIIPEFEDSIKYFFKRDNESIFKIVIFFLAESKKRAVELSEEHLDFKWVGYEEARSLIPFDNAREVLKAAHEFTD